MVLLIVILGATLIYFTFETQKKSTIETTNKLFEYSSTQTKEKLFSLIAPAETFVELSSRLSGNGMSDQSKFMAFLPYMFQSLLSTPWISSVYIGYENGDFLMIESLHDDPKTRIALSAPKEAAFFLKKIIHNTNNNPVVTFTFFNDELETISTKEVTHKGYDPRLRPWYQTAMTQKETIITDPYLFFTTGHVGITAARILDKGNGVVGADSTLRDLLGSLSANKITESTEITVFGGDGSVITTTSTSVLEELQQQATDKQKGGITLEQLPDSVTTALYDQHKVTKQDLTTVITTDHESWYAQVSRVPSSRGREVYLAIASPMQELLASALATREKNILIFACSLITTIIAVLLVSKRVALPLEALSKKAEEIRAFKLDKPIDVSTRIAEVDELTKSMTIMQSAINRFVEIARALSAEKHMDQVLELILNEVQTITGADGGAIGLIHNEGQELQYVITKNSISRIHMGGTSGVPIECNSSLEYKDSSTLHTIEAKVINDGTTCHFNNINSNQDIDFSAIKHLHEQEDYSCCSLLLIPLLNRQEEVIGLLHLVNARNPENNQITDFDKHRVSYVEALTSNAALALDNNRLFQAQKELFDSFVRLIAGAIDTKSPYTGGHCQRVPVLARMLADAACTSTDLPFADFSLDEDQEHELYIASWLHDCGKITTPEYVVDKATKLETLYNRIHEIRMRFEVLWRDVELNYFRERYKDDPFPTEQLELIEKYRQQLRDDFEFVAQCNKGAESMSEEDKERLHQIGSQTWTRYFKDNLGLSEAEHRQKQQSPLQQPPVTERLLADKGEHLIPHLSKENLQYSRGFFMQPPEHAFNLGELYNLSISQGTLSTEERYTINKHIVQTITMLEDLPFPKELKRVPEWAGNHHEKLDSKGYPRCLSAKELSIPARIMAIADIFEALTASDRPYKRPNGLKESLEIMEEMSRKGHICPDLFKLFINSKTYLKYAEQYLKNEQIDIPDGSALARQTS